MSRAYLGNDDPRASRTSRSARGRWLKPGERARVPLTDGDGHKVAWTMVENITDHNVFLYETPPPGWSFRAAP